MTDNILRQRIAAYPLVLLPLLLAGCGHGSGGLKMPEWDPAAAADRALKQYDANGDHKLSRDELKKSPGLLSALVRFDADRDGSISDAELTAKFKEIHEQRTALIELACSVTSSGRPLKDATVTLVPEAFMGDEFKSASGITGADGGVFPSIPDEDLPKDLRGKARGVPCGIYRVTVSHPQVKVPTRYSDQTELGRTVAPREREPLVINL